MTISYDNNSNCSNNYDCDNNHDTDHYYNGFHSGKQIRLILINIRIKWKDTSDYHEIEHENKEILTIKILEIK